MLIKSPTCIIKNYANHEIFNAFCKQTDPVRVTNSH